MIFTHNLGNAAKDLRAKRIIPRHIQIALRGDEELSALVKNVIVVGGGVMPFIHGALEHPVDTLHNKDTSGQ